MTIVNANSSNNTWWNALKGRVLIIARKPKHIILVAWVPIIIKTKEYNHWWRNMIDEVKLLMIEYVNIHRLSEFDKILEN